MNSNKLFPLNIETIQSSFLAKVKDLSMLWHVWYGHLNFGGLKILKQKKIVIGLWNFFVLSKVCEECVVSNLTRFQFSKENRRAKQVMERVHFRHLRSSSPFLNEGKNIFCYLHWWFFEEELTLLSTEKAWGF